MISKLFLIILISLHFCISCKSQTDTTEPKQIEIRITKEKINPSVLLRDSNALANDFLGFKKFRDFTQKNTDSGYIYISRISYSISNNTNKALMKRFQAKDDFDSLCLDFSNQYFVNYSWLFKSKKAFKNATINLIIIYDTKLKNVYLAIEEYRDDNFVKSYEKEINVY